jgi:2-polyprenyl-6-methoxyphenol hydroxylase-like FAD-dependent oxidoreductase
MTQRHAEIAGAGFAGLTLGAALAQRGWSVRIHERSPECRAFGAGIWFWENGVRVLNAIGACDEALDGAVMTPSWRSLDANGKVIDHFRFGNHETGGRTFCIVRQTLYQAVYNAALRHGVEIVTSSTAEGATPEGELLIAGGKRHKADLVIGADGVNSAVRDSLGLLKRRRVHNDGAIRVVVPFTDDDLANPDWTRIEERWSGNRRVLYTPCSRDTLYLCLTSVASDREALSVPVPKEAWARSIPAYEKFIERIPDEGRWDQFETVYLHRWSEGRVGILGDAAHGMVPGLGQGCGSAVCNAFGLAVTLDEEADVAAALQRWEARERALTEHTQFWSWTTWPLTRVPSGVARAVFNAPGLRGYIANQRARRSLAIPYGTEADARWLPPEMRSAA